jgi:hypothetical protein
VSHVFWQHPVVPEIRAQFYAGDHLTGTWDQQTTTTATLWVNWQTGNDAFTRAQVRAGNGAVQWQTVIRATWGRSDRSLASVPLEAADAGDVVSIAAGTYSFTGTINDKAMPVYQTANNGDLANPIRFVADGSVRFAAPSANSPVIGSFGQQYIEWYADISQGHNWQMLCDALGEDAPTTSADPLACNTRPDTGPLLFWSATGCLVEGAVIDGGVPNDYTFSDNWNGCRFNGAQSCTLRNCDIRNFNRSAGSNHNESGTTLYESGNCLIEHNYFADSGSGFYFKDQLDTLQGNIVRFNTVENCTEGFAVSMTNEARNDIYQNLFIDCGIGFEVTGGGFSSEYIYNNTFINSGTGVFLNSPVGLGGRVWNNIFENTGGALLFLEGDTMPAASVVSFEHNVYHTFAPFYHGSDGNRDVASYQGAYGDQDIALPISITVDPLFVNPGAGDYRLQGGSPALTLGRHPDTAAIIPAGCYITGTETIGLES